MEKVRVSVLKATRYDGSELHATLKKSLSNLGGLESIIPPKSKVFVKINHLPPPSRPEKCIVTHPLFTKETLLLLLEHDLDIVVGDDIQSKKKNKDGFDISGYRNMCKELGVKLVNLREFGFREIECNGEVLQKAYISPLLLDADFIVNLPKLKTHSFTVFTGAVKNMFGTIPHGLRLNYHKSYTKNEVFSQMLVDIFSCVPPHLTLMDGILAMEGEGPSAGNPKDVGLIFASRDAVAVDAVSSRIVGFNPLDIYTTLDANERGFGKGDLDEIEIVGEDVRDARVEDFKHSTLAIGLLRRKIP
jgi:uncharacterized protein (DUF362 family)